MFKRNIRMIVFLILMLLLFSVTSCSREDPGTDTAAEDKSEKPVEQEDQNKAEEGSESGEGEDSGMKMMINDTTVTVEWENNESVKVLEKLAEDGPITVEMSAYGGFEQVGSIGQTLPSNDTGIKTKAGDIMLYSSDQMVIFYGSNSWTYTRLGRITDKSADELSDLLSGSGVVVTIVSE